MYYKEMTEYKGTVVIGAKTEVIKDKNNLGFTLKNCVKSDKNKDEYVLAQASESDLKDHKYQGLNNDVGDWCT